jgi:TolB-like protein
LLFQFGNFSIDTDRRELKGADRVIHVEPQVFDLLVHLVRNTNRVISKDELIERVWKGRIVSDAALSSRINSARNAIGDSGKKQDLIRTIQRRGFLFAADVATSDQLPIVAAPVSTPTQAPVALPLPDKPSIAVLAFQNLSGDPAQDYFADGVVEDIITGLARIKWLLVIARNSSFAYRGHPVDVKRVGRELGVRYVLEGSVRKIGDRVRINALLVDAETGVHLWADRYDRRLEDIFALQDEITLSVVGAIEPNLRDAEIERVRRKRPDSFDAYDLVLRAIPHVYAATPEEAAKALPFLRQALALEANYAGTAFSPGATRSCSCAPASRTTTAPSRSTMDRSLSRTAATTPTHSRSARSSPDWWNMTAPGRSKPSSVRSRSVRPLPSRCSSAASCSPMPKTRSAQSTGQSAPCA